MRVELAAESLETTTRERSITLPPASSISTSSASGNCASICKRRLAELSSEMSASRSISNVMTDTRTSLGWKGEGGDGGDGGAGESAGGGAGMSLVLKKVTLPSSTAI